MSFTVDIQLRCDKCGAVMAERRGLVGEERIKEARWTMQRALIGAGILTDKQQRRRTKHMCAICADSP